MQIVVATIKGKRSGKSKIIFQGISSHSLCLFLLLLFSLPLPYSSPLPPFFFFCILRRVFYIVLALLELCRPNWPLALTLPISFLILFILFLVNIQEFKFLGGCSFAQYESLKKTEKGIAIGYDFYESGK